ncbi:benzoate-CoA ligase family protein [Nannocystis bainbridge]|uniref:Benzoate-CoA ligase family protein n=1 Tax=Nannocystis bainbridge TaxID=2995303 RepID=A0ABT5DTK9_9BACT|nr:benzoate-CoA ligase family protein [Nannocystis bainbridge]MDC0716473.1 benzoate-CoA ligase family protein [Nannocystis bainbridge]
MVSSFPREYNAAVDLIERNLARGLADKIAYFDAFGPVTYAALAERVDRAGDLLRGLGLQVEQRVLLALVDTVDFVAVFLGAIKIGAVPVPVNTMLAPGDYEHLLRDSRARVLVVSDALLPKLREARVRSPWLTATVVADSPAGGPDDGHPRLRDLLQRAAPVVTAADTGPDDVAFWLYSSGSTGRPKAAVHLHAHLRRTAELYAGGVLGLREDDVVLSAAKLFFAYGLGNALTFPLTFGATAVLLAERPTPAAVFAALQERACSVFCGVPTLFASMLADKAHAAAQLPALRISTSAGEALPRHVGERWRARFGSDILDGIGSTEMLHIFLSNRPGEIRYGTTGLPVPGYALRLVDDDGAPIAGAAEGALWVNGPTAAAGYFRDRERSLQTFHGPWTRTGDRYARDADGYYTYCGRADDMLKVGGIWVSPFEVESALAAHPEVLEAAVIGHADADELVKPRAFVVVRDPAAAGPELAEALQKFVKERLAPYKYPRWIEFVAELPKTATGKIQRFRLRDG